MLVLSPLELELPELFELELRVPPDPLAVELPELVAAELEDVPDEC